MDSPARTRALEEAGGRPESLRFEPLYYRDLVHEVNPFGDVGIVTLWSPFRAVERKLNAGAPAVLDARRSRVAVVANLYGDGMYAMFCNLLYNPQIRHLVAIGQDLGLGAAGEIAAFLERGLEDAEMLGRPLKRVRGTERVFPAVAEFDEARLRETLSFHELGKLGSPQLAERLERLLHELPRSDDAPSERIHVAIPMALPDTDAQRPSQVAAHQVVRRAPLDCWEELVVRTLRFGAPVELSNGPRLELLNARAVITDPVDDPPDALAAFGFDIDRFRAYQQAMLAPELPEGISYTYGNRLRGYFDQGSGTDTLQSAIDVLRADPRTRRAYISLWDSAADLAQDDDSVARAKPCLTTLFFRVADGRLTLTATYRAHNLLTAWLQNVYGLMALQRHVAGGAGIEPGPLTVISHSLGIDPRSPRYEMARAIAERWSRDDDVDRRTGKSSLREDPNGYFVVSVDSERGRIVADHRFGGVLIKRYEAERAITIEQQVAADMAVTLVSHALWLGRELTRNERLLRQAEPGS
jgi:thymidylate synthase